MTPCKLIDFDDLINPTNAIKIKDITATNYEYVIGTESGQQSV
jgi:hypothetical protein